VTIGLLAASLATRQAAGTGVLTVFLAALATICYLRHKTSGAVMYGAGVVFGTVVTIMSATGHVFHGL
jgi:hypothetical protein